MNTPLTAPIKTPAREAAEELLIAIRRTSRVIAREFHHNIRILWNAPDPQAVLDELAAMGVRADLVFQESAKLAEYLSGVAARNQDTELGAMIQAALAPVLPTTFDADGKGTIQFPPPPEPQPENPS